MMLKGNSRSVATDWGSWSRFLIEEDVKNSLYENENIVNKGFEGNLFLVILVIYGLL